MVGRPSGSSTEQPPRKKTRQSQAPPAQCTCFVCDAPLEEQFVLSVDFHWWMCASSATSATRSAGFASTCDVQRSCGPVSQRSCVCCSSAFGGLSKVRWSDAPLFRPRRCPVSSGRPPGPALSRPHMQLHGAWKLYVAPPPAPVVAVPSPQPADQGQCRQGPTCKCTEPRADFVATRVDGTSTRLNPHEKGTKDATPTVFRLAHGIQQDQVPHR